MAQVCIGRQMKEFYLLDQLTVRIDVFVRSFSQLVTLVSRLQVFARRLIRDPSLYCPSDL